MLLLRCSRIDVNGSKIGVDATQRVYDPAAEFELRVALERDGFPHQRRLRLSVERNVVAVPLISDGLSSCHFTSQMELGTCLHWGIIGKTGLAKDP